jgi:hypothetical protein
MQPSLRTRRPVAVSWLAHGSAVTCLLLHMLAAIGVDSQRLQPRPPVQAAHSCLGLYSITGLHSRPS